MALGADITREVVSDIYDQCYKLLMRIDEEVFGLDVTVKYG
jgi:hypothetical protein